MRRRGQPSQDPALDHLHADPDLRLVSRGQRTRRQHRGPVALRQVLVGALDPRLVAAGQKTMHSQVIGKTGSGKTASVLFPAILQDALDKKGLLIASQKGPDEEIRQTKAIASIAQRVPQLRVFRLPAWNQPHIQSHTYNVIYVRPRGTRGPKDLGGDPIATAERVFSVLTPELGDNQYYNTQARIMFDKICRLLHGMVDAQGRGLPFTLRDVAVCLNGLGQKDGGWAHALAHCRERSVDRDAAHEIAAQLARLAPLTASNRIVVRLDNEGGKGEEKDHAGPAAARELRVEVVDEGQTCFTLRPAMVTQTSPLNRQFARLNAFPIPELQLFLNADREHHETENGQVSLNGVPLRGTHD